MSKITIQAELRAPELKPKAIRRQGGVPANISAAHHDSTAITLQAKELKKLLDHGQDAGLVYVEIAGEKTAVPVLFEEIQAEGMSNQILHVSFKKVSLKEKVKAEIPLVFVGEITTPNLILVKVKEFIEVEALPADLPENITVDISTLTESGQSITIKDLQFDTEKIHLTVTDEDLEAPIVLLQEPKVEVVEETPAETEGEAAAEGEKSAEAAPAADAEKPAES
jgi:large subunit ribosomal protein L25